MILVMSGTNGGFFTVIVILQTFRIPLIALIGNYLAFISFPSDFCQKRHRSYHYRDVDASIISTTCCVYVVQGACPRDEESERSDFE